MSKTAILGENEYGLAEAAILSAQLLSTTTLPDALCRPAVVITAVDQPAAVPRRVVNIRRGSGLRISLHTNHQMSLPFSTSVKAVADLLDLPKGWNSYDAKPIASKNAVRAIRLLAELLEPGTPPPAVVPRVQGGIQLEWHTKSIDIEVYIDSPEEVSFFAADTDSGRSVESSLVGQEHVLKAWVRLSGE